MAEAIVTKLIVDSREATAGASEYSRALEAAYAKVEAAMARAIVSSTTLADSRNREIQATRAIAAANDNASKSIAGTAGEVIELGLKLKTLATIGYLTWPAFRNGVNLQALPALKLLHLGLSEVAPVATAAGTAMLRSLAPAFAFLSKIALPILAIVVAWKALNALIGQGADLLEKYGNASRKFDSDDLAKNFKDLTKFQDSADVSLGQRQYAAELATRLDDAKFRLKEFVKIQLDLNDAALFLQKIWIGIIDTIARAADGTMKLIGAIGQAWDKLTSLGTEIGKKIGEAIRAYLPENIQAALAARSQTAADVAAPKTDFDISSRARALKIARGNLAAAMGVAAGEADDDANVGATFAARWNASINALKDVDTEVEKVRRGFDQLEESMQRSAAGAEAEAKAVDASVGEHARLRAEMRLQEAALQDIKKHGGDMEAYAERIKVLADRFGKAAQDAAELKLQSDIKFTGDTLFLSDADKQIASILRQVHGKDWKSFMDSPIADAMRFNILLKDTVDTVRDIGQTIASSIVRSLMDGTNVMDGLSNALKNLSMRLADKAIENLLSGNFAQAAIAGISAAVTFIGSKLTNRDEEKRLEEAKNRFADMAVEVRNFNAAADGFELSQFVTAIQQITRTGLELVKAAMAAGDTVAAVQLIHAGVRQINNTVDQYIRPRGNTVPEQIANENAQAQQLIAEMNALNTQYGLGLNRTADILAGAADHIAEIQRKAEEEIERRSKGYIDRLLVATADTTAVCGELQLLDRRPVRRADNDNNTRHDAAPAESAPAHDERKAA